MEVRTAGFIRHILINLAAAPVLATRGRQGLNYFTVCFMISGVYGNVAPVCSGPLHILNLKLNHCFELNLLC